MPASIQQPTIRGPETLGVTPRRHEQQPPSVVLPAPKELQTGPSFIPELSGACLAAELCKRGGRRIAMAQDDAELLIATSQASRSVRPRDADARSEAQPKRRRGTGCRR